MTKKPIKPLCLWRPNALTVLRRRLILLVLPFLQGDYNSASARLFAVLGHESLAEQILREGIRILGSSEYLMECLGRGVFSAQRLDR